MAVVRVEPLWEGRGATFEADGNRTYFAKVRVETDSVLDGQITVKFADGVPKVGVGHYVSSEGIPDPYAVCTRADPRQDDDSGRHWVVDCEFSTRGLTRDPGGFGGGAAGGYKPGGGGAADDPTLEPPEVSFDFESHTKPIRRQLKDAAGDTPTWLGDPCTNSAGDYFDPLPEREIGWPVLVYTRTEAAFDVARARKYAFAMNRDAWLGLGPKQAQMMPVLARAVYKGAVRFWRVTYRVRFTLVTGEGVTWNPVVADAGFRQLDGGVLSDILDPKTQQPVTVPQFLNGAGMPLTPAQISDPKVGPKYKEISAYRLVDFAPLKIVL